MRNAMLASLLCLAVACAGQGGSDAKPTALQTTESPSPTQSTSPTPDPQPDNVMLRFVVLGDWGSGSSEQYSLAERMCRWREDHPYNLVITTGDNIYPGGEPENFDYNFFRPYDCLLDAGVRWRSTLGNHDIVTDDGRPELNEPRFGLKRRQYIVRKKGVRFVMWDSNRSDKDWLRRNAGEERGDRWTVVAFHHPVFTPGPHGPTPGYRPSLPRIFARKGVDLVVNGHDHLYARIEPKRRVRYLVTGGGGASVYGCDHPEMAEVCLERYHFLYVVVKKNEIDIRAVPIAGEPIDRFTMTGRP